MRRSRFLNNLEKSPRSWLPCRIQIESDSELSSLGEVAFLPQPLRDRTITPNSQARKPLAPFSRCLQETNRVHPFGSPVLSDLSVDTTLSVSSPLKQQPCADEELTCPDQENASCSADPSVAARTEEVCRTTALPPPPFSHDGPHANSPKKSDAQAEAAEVLPVFPQMCQAADTETHCLLPESQVEVSTQEETAGAAADRAESAEQSHVPAPSSPRLPPEREPTASTPASVVTCVPQGASVSLPRLLRSSCPASETFRRMRRGGASSSHSLSRSCELRPLPATRSLLPLSPCTRPTSAGSNLPPPLPSTAFSSDSEPRLPLLPLNRHTTPSETPHSTSKENLSPQKAERRDRSLAVSEPRNPRPSLSNSAPHSKGDGRPQIRREGRRRDEVFQSGEWQKGNNGECQGHVEGVKRGSAQSERQSTSSLRGSIEGDGIGREPSGRGGTGYPIRSSSSPPVSEKGVERSRSAPNRIPLNLKCRPSHHEEEEESMPREGSAGSRWENGQREESRLHRGPLDSSRDHSAPAALSVAPLPLLDTSGLPALCVETRWGPVELRENGEFEMPFGKGKGKRGSASVHGCRFVYVVEFGGLMVRQERVEPPGEEVESPMESPRRRRVLSRVHFRQQGPRGVARYRYALDLVASLRASVERVELFGDGGGRFRLMSNGPVADFVAEFPPPARHEGSGGTLLASASVKGGRATLTSFAGHSVSWTLRTGVGPPSALLHGALRPLDRASVDGLDGGARAARDLFDVADVWSKWEAFLGAWRVCTDRGAAADRQAARFLASIVSVSPGTLLMEGGPEALEGAEGAHTGMLRRRVEKGLFPVRLSGRWEKPVQRDGAALGRWVVSGQGPAEGLGRRGN